MISKRDSKPFLVKFPIGTQKTTKIETLYESDWNTVYGLISDPQGSLRNNVYGYDLMFDKTIIVNAGSITRKINYNTIIMIDNMPSDNYPKGDYYISRIFPEYNGEIVIGLMKQQDVNRPKIYFYNNERLLYVQTNVDKETNIAYFNKNEIIPFDAEDFVWLKEPLDAEDNENRYRIVNINNVGFDGHYTPFVEVVFEKVEEDG